MKYVFIYLFLFSLSPGLFSQNNLRAFSLREAQDFALTHNKNLLNLQQDIRLARMRVEEARAGGLPQLSGSMDYMTNFNYEFELAFGGTSEPPQIDFTKLDAGDIEVLGVLDQLSASSGPATIKMEDQLNASVQLSQLIYSGQYWVGLEMAKMAADLSEKSVRLTENDLKEQVINSYQMILITQKMLEVMQQNEEKLVDIKQHTQNMYEAGLAEQTDVDQLSINLSQIRNGIRTMERNLELSYNMLRFVLGLEEKSPVTLTTTLEERMEETIRDMIRKDTFDIARNPTYDLMKEQEKLGEQGIKLQKWAYAPSLVGFYSYKKKILTSGFDLSPNHAAGISLSVPIWNGGATKIQVDKAKIEMEKAKRNTDLLRDQLSLQNEQVKFDLQNAFDNYQTQMENVAVAKRVLASYQNKYRAGTISSLELTQANVNYLQAENNYISSIMDLMKARLAMDKLYNNL